MANLSDLTRKEQVLAHLQQAHGAWVDGPELANERVGGSEGLKRLRELRDEGYDIRRRQHPNQDLDIHQYRLVPPPIDLGVDHDELLDLFDDARPNYPSVKDAAEERIEREVEAALLDPEPAPSAWPADHDQTPIARAVRRKEDGTYEYVPPQRPLDVDQIPINPEPEPASDIWAFSSMPKHVDFGSVAICPRCRSKTTRGRQSKRKKLETEEHRKDDGPKLIDEDGVLLFRDPYSKKVEPCRQCNGYGIVPNRGPVA